MLKGALGIINDQFSRFSQNDAHECLTSLINILGEELANQNKENIFEKYLKGYTKVAKKCLKCDNFTNKTEEFLFLSMSIPY